MALILPSLVPTALAVGLQEVVNSPSQPPLPPPTPTAVCWPGLALNNRMPGAWTSRGLAPSASSPGKQLFVAVQVPWAVCASVPAGPPAGRLPRTVHQISLSFRRRHRAAAAEGRRLAQSLRKRPLQCPSGPLLILSENTDRSLLRETSVESLLTGRHHTRDPPAGRAPGACPQGAASTRDGGSGHSQNKGKEDGIVIVEGEEERVPNRGAPETSDTWT